MRHKGVNVLWIAGGAALLALAARSKKARAAFDGPVLEVDSPTIVDVTPYPTGRQSSAETGPINSRKNQALPSPSDGAPTDDEADAAAAAAKAAELLEAAHAPAPNPATRKPSKRTAPPLPSKRTDDTKIDPAPHEPPTPAPTPASTLPNGYDSTKARKTAPALAEHLRRKAYDYDRRLVKAWQTTAALEPDGIYGGATRGALIHYGVASPPKALFKPTQTIPYTPPE